MPWRGKDTACAVGNGLPQDAIAAMQRSFVTRTFVKDKKVPSQIRVKAVPPHVTGFQSWKKRGRDGKFKDRGWAEWLVPPGVSKTSPRILYFHGGGYKFMSPPQVRPTTARLAIEAGMPVLCIDYRKIPENRHPAQIEDARYALQWLASHGPDGPGPASALFCAGDSAGGGLALGLAVSIRDNPLGSVKIAGITVVSPMTDLTCSGESYRTRRWREGGGDKCDPLFRGADPAADSMPEIYELVGKPGHVGSFKLTEPDVSPLHADLHNLPPSLIQVGDAEVMLSDSVDFGTKAQAAGSPVEVQVYPRMWHCFHRFSEGCGTGVVLQEGIDAVKCQGAFLRQLSPSVCLASNLNAEQPSGQGHVNLIQQPLEKGLAEAIQQHLDKDLVKGWEAHLRIVNGERRRPLQKAAKAARAASDRWHEGHGSVTAQQDYFAKIKLLLQELEAATESDFDGLLKEALVCLEGFGVLASDLPPLNEEETAALERIWNHRFGGVGKYKGFARDRDLRRAAELRQEVLRALSAYQRAVDAQSGHEARAAYAHAVDELRREIESAGEIDFDGLLRQAVRVLERGFVCKPAQKSTQAREDPPVARPTPTSQSSKAKTARRWRPKESSADPQTQKLMGA
mmetsp:Transcript_141006/g.243716  ORF Transcript_141006/g.243716 Transcript_141006/m.243716 type:complete len:625 (-) Transcript_141006:28-1902(-)